MSSLSEHKNLVSANSAATQGRFEGKVSRLGAFQSQLQRLKCYVCVIHEILTSGRPPYTKTPPTVLGWTWPAGGCSLQPTARKHKRTEENSNSQLNCLLFVFFCHRIHFFCFTIINEQTTSAYLPLALGLHPCVDFIYLLREHVKLRDDELLPESLDQQDNVPADTPERKTTQRSGTRKRLLERRSLVLPLLTHISQYRVRNSDHSQDDRGQCGLISGSRFMALTPNELNDYMILKGHKLLSYS